jgi:HEAT repeat protein
MGFFGPPDVHKLKEKGDVNGLIRALGYRQAALVRQQAAQALGEFNASSAVAPLIKALGDDEYKVVKAALAALVNLGSPEAYLPMLAVLRHPVCGFEAGTLLAKLDQQVDQNDLRRKALEQILGLANEGDRHLRNHALNLLRRLGPHLTGFPELRQRIAAVLLVEAESGDISSEIALGEMGWEPPRDETWARRFSETERWGSAVACGEVAVQSMLEAIQKGVREPQKAIQALGKIGGMQALTALGSLAAGSNWLNRSVAIEELGYSASAEAVALLLDLLGQEDWSVRWHAMKALSRLYHCGQLKPDQASHLLRSCEKVFDVHSDTRNCGENIHVYLREAFDL